MIRTAMVVLLACCVIQLAAFDAPAARKRKPPKDMKTLMCKRGKVLFSDDFSSEKISDEWKTALGQWEIVDGALKGVELEKDNHAAVIRHDMEYKNLVAQFSFKFEGGKATSFSCNNKDGHVCRLSINPTGFSVRKDKSRAEGADEAKTLDTCSFEFRPGEWYTILLEIYEGEMLAYLDERFFALGEHDGVNVEKTNFTFPVSGDAIYFDDVRIWEALPNRTWKRTRKKLEAIRARLRADQQ